MADWLWQVLCEMGIHANLQVEVKFPPSVYATVDDAVSDFSQRLKCSTASHKETVSNYFQSVLRQEDNGFVLGGRNTWSTYLVDQGIAHSDYTGYS